MDGITLSDMDFHKRIGDKYHKFKIIPSGFPSLIFYKDPDYQKRDIKIGILLKLHYDIRNEAFAAWNSILVMKGRMERYIPQIVKASDLPAIFLVFKEKVMISHQAVMSRLQRMLTIPGSAFPPASWHPASTVSQLFLAAYEFGQRVNRFPDLRITGSVRTERKSGLNPPQTGKYYPVYHSLFEQENPWLSLRNFSYYNNNIFSKPGSSIPDFISDAAPRGRAMNLYISGQSGYEQIIKPKLPDISYSNVHTSDISSVGAHDNHPEKQLLKRRWAPDHGPVQIRKLSMHDSMGFNESRLNTLNQAQYVSNIFSEEPEIYHVDHIPVIIPQIRKMMSLFKQVESTVKDHNKEYPTVFGSEVILAQVRFFLNNKEITGAVSHPEVYNISSLVNGYRNHVRILMHQPSGNIFYPTFSAQKENPGEYYSIFKHAAPAGQLLQGKNAGFDKEAQNVSSQNLTDFKRATSMNLIDTDLVYTRDQRNMETEVVEIKKIIEETKRAIPDKKEIQMTEKNVDTDALRRININQISDQVYQMIDRKIKIEAERRGIL